MPKGKEFRSKAQMRFMFAKHPKIAKRWVARASRKYLKRLPSRARRRR